MKEPLVSVMMPAFNVEMYIADAIKSILTQSYQNWELVMADDASSDQTREIIASFKDPRIKLAQNHSNLGLAGNRNKVLSLTKGEYLAVLDADDLSSPQRLEKQVACFLANSELVMCGSWATVINEQGLKQNEWRFPVQSAAIKAQFYLQFPIVHSSAMFKKSSLFELDHLYDPLFAPAEDYDLCFRMLAKGEVEIIPEFFVKHRLHASNTSKKNSQTLTSAIPQLLRRECNLLQISATDSECQNLAFFLNPQAKIKVNLQSAGQLLLELNQAVVKTYQLMWFQNLKWWWYITKTFFLQLRNLIT